MKTIMYRTRKNFKNIEEFTVVKVTEKSVTYLRRKWNSSLTDLNKKKTKE